jgi:hypothetical protein
MLPLTSISFPLTKRNRSSQATANLTNSFGLNGDPFIAIPQNVSSIVDLLEDKGISWSLYQEDLPYSGFQGFAWVNQKTGANDYVRKHK